jgi:uncharacterized protein (DUF924 family)
MTQNLSRAIQASIEAVIAFWRNAGPDRWFAKDPAFDAQFRARFLGAHLAAAARELDAWCTTANGALALAILLDQFPRNAFRGTAHMFATDGLARMFADRAITAELDAQIAPSLRPFLYLPFEHSERLEDQSRSVELHERLGAPLAEYARIHCDIVRRFGRFPHRNAVLGRETTPDEQAFLDGGGFSG